MNNVSHETTESGEQLNRTRRQIIAVLSTGIGIGLAGCNSGQETTSGQTTRNTATGAHTTSGGQGTTSGQTTNAGSDKSGNTTNKTNESVSAKPPEYTYNIAMGAEPKTLDAHKTTSRRAVTVLGGGVETLFLVNRNKKIVPHIATGSKVNDDATQYVFGIRDDVTFHDGEPLDAKAVKWNLERFLEVGPNAYKIGPIDNIKATGDYEVTINYKSSFPLLLRNLTYGNSYFTGLMSPTAVKKAGDSYGTQSFVGTGPYKFEKWKKGSEIVFSRYKKYDWGPDFAHNKGPGKHGKVVYKILPEPTTLNSELTSGDIHGSNYVGLSDAKKIGQNSNTSIQRKKWTRPLFLAFNIDNNPTSDLKMREGIAHAINRESVLKAGVNGEGFLNYNIVTPTTINSISKKRAKKLARHYNLKTARQKLEEAGWTNSNKGETRSKNDKTLKLTFLSVKLPRYVKSTKVIQSMLSKVGINTQVEVNEVGTYLKRMKNGDSDIMVGVNSGNYATGSMERALLSDRAADPNGGENYGNYSSKKMDKLIKKAQKATDSADREEKIKEAQVLYHKDLPQHPIIGTNKIYGYKNTVENTDQFFSHAWWPTQWYLDKLELTLAEKDR